MKRKIEILIVFMLICLCATIIVTDRYIETKIAYKSSDYAVNTKFESLPNENNNEINNENNNEITNINISDSTSESVSLNSVIYAEIPEIKNIEKGKSIYKINFDETAQQKSAYTLACFDYDISTLSNIINSMHNEDLLTEEEYINAQQIYNNLFYETTLKGSKINDDKPVSNYYDKIGFAIDTEGKITNIEVYDKGYVFSQDTNLYNFKEITESLGIGRLVIESEENYNYYKLMYRYENVLVSFVSFYADGRNNVCVISPIYSD